MKNKPGKIIRSAVVKVDRKLHTRRGRNVMLYLMCLIVAFIFWSIITLDETMERDFDLSVELVNVPDSVVVVGNLPQSINVVLKGKGTQFVKYSVVKPPVFTVDFREFGRNGFVALSRTKIDSELRDIFGQNISIIVVNPDSMRVAYSSGNGFRVPLRVNSSVSASTRSIISGPVVAALDSVTVYTASGKRPDLEYVETETVSRDELTDTMVCDIAVKQLPGMKIMPETVSVTIPAELLVSKKRTVPVKAVNVPAGARLITYPASVEVSYLVPMRLSSSDMPVKASVDYKALNAGSRNAKVEVEAMPGGYKVVSVSQDSVEYVIER